MRLAERTDRIVIGLLAALALYHASLLGKGALAWPDEHLARRSIDAASALARGDLIATAAALSAWGSRPAEYLLRTPAAAVQLLVERWTGISPLSPLSLPIATAQNVVVAFLLGVVFFRVSKKLLPAGYAAVAGMAFALTTGNHIWVRHLVPYDVALLVHLLALGSAFGLSTERASASFLRRVVLSGGVVGLLVLAYPIVFFRARNLGLAMAATVLLSLVGSTIWLRNLTSRAGFDQAYRTGLASGIALALYPAYYSFVPALGLFILFGGEGTGSSLRLCQA